MVDILTAIFPAVKTGMVDNDEEKWKHECRKALKRVDLHLFNFVTMATKQQLVFVYPHIMQLNC